MRRVAALLNLCSIVAAVTVYDRAVAAPTDVARFTFDDNAAGASRHGQSVRHAGAAMAPAVVLSPASSTHLTTVTNPVAGRGRALRFGDADCRGSSPVRCARLARVSVPAGSGSLSPGTRNFSYGAMVRLTAAPRTGAAGGMNVMQLGLSSTADMWKLQLDGGAPSCVVRNDGRSATVRRPTALKPGVPYRLQCTRTNGRLTLAVTPIYSSGVAGPAEAIRTAAASSAGSLVSFGSAPMFHIGSKGSTTNPDQLSNAIVDDVFVAMG